MGIYVVFVGIWVPSWDQKGNSGSQTRRQPRMALAAELGPDGIFGSDKARDHLELAAELSKEWGPPFSQEERNILKKGRGTIRPAAPVFSSRLVNSW